jgi:hypothetical protein
MTGLHALWLPMVLSSVAIFLASAVIHMFSGLHKNDHLTPPNQDGLADALRPFNLAPGDYMIPRPASMKDMGSPEFKAKSERGPKLVFTVFPNGITPMGPLLAKWFVYSLVISLCSGYVASRALPVGADYLHVFRFAGIAAFLGYAGAIPQASIWYGKSWGTTMRSTIDGLIYAGLTAGMYGWLWPR